jgi:aprataxin
MQQVHLHVISRDLEGPGMKKPQHWRSFCAPFFRSLDMVQQEIVAHGHAVIDFEQIAACKQSPLLCQWCGEASPNLPAIKRHIAVCSCRPPVPLDAHVQ